MFALLGRGIGVAHFGEWLYEARKKANLTQEELADRAGVSKNYISVLERNLPNYKSGALPNPSRKVLTVLSTALGVTKAAVFQAWSQYGNGEEVAPSFTYESAAEPLTAEEERRILSRFEGRPRRQRERLERVLDTLLTEFPDVEYDATTHGKKAE